MVLIDAVLCLWCCQNVKLIAMLFVVLLVLSSWVPDFYSVVVVWCYQAGLLGILIALVL